MNARENDSTPSGEPSTLLGPDFTQSDQERYLLAVGNWREGRADAGDVTAIDLVEQKRPDLKATREGLPQEPTNVADVSQPPEEIAGRPLIQDMGTEVERIRWLVSGWLPGGMVTVCAAEGGSGKGVLTAKVAAGITSGRNPFNGDSIGDPGRVIMLSEQDSLPYVQRPRCIAAGADMGLMSIIDRRALDQPQQLAREVKEAGVKLIVLDQMIGGLSADRKSNSDVDVAEHMQHLQALAESTGAAILVILHTVKGGSNRLKENSSLRDLVRGSGAWIDVCRLAWLIFADVNCAELSRVLVRAKCNLPVDWSMGGLRLYGHDVPVEGGEDATVIHRVEIVEGTNREIVEAAITRKADLDDVANLPKYKQAATAILECLPEEGPMLQSTVYDKLEFFSQGTISKAIEHLLKQARRIGRQAASNFPELGEVNQSALAIYRTE